MIFKIEIRWLNTKLKAKKKTTQLTSALADSRRNSGKFHSDENGYPKKFKKKSQYRLILIKCSSLERDCVLCLFHPSQSFTSIIINLLTFIRYRKVTMQDGPNGKFGAKSNPCLSIGLGV